jgi:hypothetical protein
MDLRLRYIVTSSLMECTRLTKAQILTDVVILSIPDFLSEVSQPHHFAKQLTYIATRRRLNSVGLTHEN